MAWLTSLPVELLHHICAYLSCKDVLQLTLANRYFNNFLYSNLFHNVTLRHPSNLRLFLIAIENGQLGDTSFGLKTRTLKLEHTPITGQQLTTLLNDCPHITELDVDSTVWLSICPPKSSQPWNPRSESFRQSLNMTFTKYMNLSSLSLNLAGYMSHAIDIHQLLSLLSGLKTLKLFSVFHVFTMNDMEKIHAHCPRLIDLTVTGFCLNRVRPSLPLIQNPTLRHLTIKFASGWSYYYSWLWYIGHKYTGLSSVVCECTAAMGIRSSNARDELDMVDGFTAFAQQHALTLQKLELINLTFDIRFMDALQTPNMNAISTATTELMDWDMDNKHSTQTTTTLASRPKAITSARFSNHTTFIQSDVFLAILQYVQQTIRTLNISWPLMTINNPQLFDSLTACTFLTDLTIELPAYMFGIVDSQGLVPFDRILQACPLLTAFHVIHGKIIIVGDSMANNHAHQLNHPLKNLVLETVYIPTSFMVMENHGLLNLERISLDHCIIYDLVPPTSADPSIMLDWLFPVPAATNGDSISTVPRRPLSVSLFHVHFVNPESVRTSLFCDYISLSQHGKGEEDSWCIRSTYVQKMVRMTSPMLRRKSGQVKRKNNRRQVPSEYHDGDMTVAPNVGILISCYSMDSLRVNGRELI